jgi:hypothetical protein
MLIRLWAGQLFVQRIDIFAIHKEVPQGEHCARLFP